MIKYLFIFVIINATLILAQEYDCGENHKHIRIGVGIMLTEQWKPIKGYEGIYEISNFGRVKSLERKCENSGSYSRSISISERELKPEITRTGYYRVCLQKDGKRKKKLIHILVWEQFGHEQKTNNNTVVDHINSNKSDNQISNLQLLTFRENIIKERLDYPNRKSRFGGVSMMQDGRDKKWRARLRNKCLGYYFTQSEAALAYQKELIKTGEFHV